MKTQNTLVILFIFTLLLSCNSEDNTDIPPEVNATNTYIKKATLSDDGQAADPKKFLYNTNNKLVQIVNGTFIVTDISYDNDIITEITETYSNGNVVEYAVSLNNNTISLTTASVVREIDFTNEYVDAYRIINQNPTQLVVESTFTRNANNNITVYQTTSSSNTNTNTYNYLSHDNKNSTSTYNNFNNDHMLIFGLKASKNNPITSEYIYNNNTPTTIDYSFQYDENDNVTQLNQSVVQIDYEYVEL